MQATHSRQRTVPVTCSTRRRTISCGIADRLRQHIGDHRHHRRLDRRPSPAPPPWRRRPAASARNGTARTPAAASRAWRPCALAISTARSTAALSPETTTWPPPLSLATWQTSPCAASAATAAAASNSSPSSAAMAPAPTGTAFCMAWPRMRSSRAVSAMRERAGRGKRRIFAERMAGDELRVAREIDAGLGLQHAHRRERHRHQRRLRVLGQRERLGRPLPHDRRRASRRAPRRPRRRPRAPAAKASASALPMPTAWLPCPGKTKATDIPHPSRMSSRRRHRAIRGVKQCDGSA